MQDRKGLITGNLGRRDFFPPKVSALLEYLKTKCRQEYVIMIVLLLSAVVLRLNGLGEHSLWIDEAGTYVLVESFMAEGVPQYPSGEESYRSMPFILVTSLSVYLLGSTEFALRLPSLVFGSLTILLVFLWSKKLFGVKAACVASGVISISSWHIAKSQDARMYVLFSLLYFATFYYLYNYKNTGRIYYMLITVFLAILSLLTHVTGYVLVFILPVYILLVGPNSSRMILSMAFSTSIMIFITEYFYFDIIDVLGRFQMSQEYIFGHLDWLLRNEPILSILGFLGILAAYLEDRGLFYLYFIAVIPPLLVYSFFVDLKASRYVFFILPFLSVMIGCLYHSAIKRFSFSRIQSYFLVLCIGLGLIITSYPLDPDLGSHAPQPDYKPIYNYIGDHKADEDIVVVGRPLPANYYLGNPDFVLLEESLDEELVTEDKEFYSGSPVIEDSEGFSEVVNQSGSGWVVTTESVQRGVETELKQEIQELERVKSRNKIKLWSW